MTKPGEDMGTEHEVIAVVFDFDDTLVPDSTTQLLSSRGVDPKEFWREAKELAERGFDPTLGWLELFLEKVGEKKPLGKLTNEDLKAFGRTLDSKFFPGVKGLFRDLQSSVRRFRNIDIEFYIVSGGLKELICGSQVVSSNFRGVYACELAAGATGSSLSRIKRCVTFTEKTRYLFEINKGLDVSQTEKDPYLVNRDVPENKRRIPFPNMIYVGDGLTDIPCFSLLKRFEGTPFGVFRPKEETSAKRAFLEFLKTDRVVSCHAPRYRSSDELGSLLRAAVVNRCTTIDLTRQVAVSKST